MPEPIRIPRDDSVERAEAAAALLKLSSGKGRKTRSGRRVSRRRGRKTRRNRK